jgi:hypothetical protein
MSHGSRNIELVRRWYEAVGSHFENPQALDRDRALEAADSGP